MSRRPDPPAPELAVWNVKNFPVELRERITDAAARANVTVGEWVTVFFERHWTEQGEDGQITPLFPNGVSRPKRAAGDVQELHELARLAREFTPDGRDSEAMQIGRSLVRDRLKAMREAEPARETQAPRTDRLTGPKQPKLIAQERLDLDGEPHGGTDAGDAKDNGRGRGSRPARLPAQASEVGE